MGWITLLAAMAAATIGYAQSRSFVRGRMRYVDAVQHPLAPLVAAAGAIAIATPVAWLLPFVGGGTALLFGASVGLGVAAGRRDIHRSLPPAR